MSDSRLTREIRERHERWLETSVGVSVASEGDLIGYLLALSLTLDDLSQRLRALEPRSARP